jgi:hypothetical protein
VCFCVATLSFVQEQKGSPYRVLPYAQHVLSTLFSLARTKAERKIIPKSDYGRFVIEIFPLFFFRL